MSHNRRFLVLRLSHSCSDSGNARSPAAGTDDLDILKLRRNRHRVGRCSAKQWPSCADVMKTGIFIRSRQIFFNYKTVWCFDVFVADRTESRFQRADNIASFSVGFTI
jgi:hypothetical protein